MERVTPSEVCVIGAGASGLAACRSLVERGIPFDCYEKGSAIGGGWRYRNDTGVSAVYSSLRTNTSRKAMRVAALPMPRHFGHFPHHTQVLAWLESFVDHFGLRERIQLSREVTRVEPRPGGSWRVILDDDTEREYAAVVVANGHSWDARWPQVGGDFAGEQIHSRDYRTPEPFTAKRVAVVGFGSSAAEIASEVSRVADTTYLSVRRTAHVAPRNVGPIPFDHLDTRLASRLPWPLQRSTAATLLRLLQGRLRRYGLPTPDHKLLHGQVTVSNDVLRLIRRGRIRPKPVIERLLGDRVRFADGSEEAVDRIIYATGYKVSFPFFPPELLATDGDDIPVYQRIVHPDLPGIYFVGLIDAFTGLFPVVEAQCEWIADVLDGVLELPAHEDMWAAIETEADRLATRYSDSKRYTRMRARHPYLKALARERGQARGRSRGRYGRSAWSLRPLPAGEAGES